jgi:hypothetical protein
MKRHTIAAEAGRMVSPIIQPQRDDVDKRESAIVAPPGARSLDGLRRSWGEAPWLPARAPRIQPDRVFASMRTGPLLDAE